ncbi:MAG TPA: RdgB/HAM1 family non-canonical purine NTP pyrophosphatase [Vicinamibacterales bacterium]|nr:RdgB/HAM1 family non-canonical purine NTP pyrophosphatase [Vicinamibacterales bacterium]
MTPARRIVLATTNPDKIREIRSILDDLPIELATLADFPPVDPPEETGTTFAENAALKATYYSRATGVPAVAEDSGLEIDALDGAPGIHSARFGGETATYPERFGKLYEMLDARGGRDSTARFVCHVALAHGDRVIFEARGVVEGRVSPEPRGTHGFGYDPIFFHPPSGMTLAEVSDERKRAVSHRGEAFRKLAEFLRSHACS